MAPAAEPGYRLDVRGLSYEAGGAKILTDINLSLRSGELVALLGPSGSGKSTLLTSMIGFRRAKGRVELCGRDLYASFEQLKTLIGFVPQDDVVPLALSARKTLTYAAKLRLPAAMPDTSREALVRSVLADVELTERADVRTKSLSGGQRKRVSLAVELLSKPPLLFLDEPTSGLDPDLEEKTMALFRRLTTQDRLTVVTTHVLASLSLVDHALIVSKGRVVYFGPPKEAPAFFGVSDFPSIYRCLSGSSPDELVKKYIATSLYRELIAARLAGEPPPLPARTPPSAPSPSSSSSSPSRPEA